MSKYIKRKELIIYLAFIVSFSLLALLIDWQGFFANDIFSQPLKWIGDGIRHIGVKSNAGAYTIYIFIGLLPLVYPVVQIIRSKKIKWHYLSWLVLSIFMFIIIYFAINPHRINFAIENQNDFPVEAISYFQNITLLGLFITFIAMLAFCLILEFHFKLKNGDMKIYVYARALFTILIIAVFSTVFFFGLIQIKLEIKQVLENELLNINNAVNIFIIILIFIIKFIPAFFNFVLFVLSKAFIGDMKNDIFAKSNMERLNRIIKVCLINIFAALGSMIVVNILYFVLSGYLLNVFYTVSIPFATVMAACLITIFAKILIKSIRLNEDSKLVI